MINGMGIDVYEVVLDVEILFFNDGNIGNCEVDDIVVEEVVVVLSVFDIEGGCIIDLVCMYMCEMGIVELLICEGEIVIVKCIEEGFL